MNYIINMVNNRFFIFLDNPYGFILALKSMILSTFSCAIIFLNLRHAQTFA